MVNKLKGHKNKNKINAKHKVMIQIKKNMKNVHKRKIDANKSLKKMNVSKSKSTHA